MDWVWRIGFFIILYFIGQALADVKLVTPNYSSGRVDEKAALVNALLPSIIIAFGALPLVMKVFRKRKTNVIVNKPTHFSDSHLSEPLNYVPEADDKISAAQKRKDDEKLYQAVAEELSRDEKKRVFGLRLLPKRMEMKIKLRPDMWSFVFSH